MPEIATHFLPPGREKIEALLPVARRFKESITGNLFDSLPVAVVILTEGRQVIYCNARFRGLAEEAGVTEVVGKRPGEALGCVHAHLMEGGCGTSRFCRQCGAAIAILESFQDKQGLQECLMKRRFDSREEDLVLQVFTTNFTFGDQDLVLFSAIDVRHEKRAQEMEHLVFHKLLNSASGMVMLTNLIEDEAGEAMTEYTRPLRDAAKRLVGHIRQQQVWRSAEQGRLRVLPEPVRPEHLLREVLMEATGQDPDRELDCLLDCSCNNELRSDPALLRLILSVFMENAFEAMPKGSLVVLGCREVENRLSFFVCNEGVPTEAVRNQLFKRSFTTKSVGRGFGLYRAKLLAEHYLDGRVGVELDDNRITFFVELPGELAGNE